MSNLLIHSPIDRHFGHFYLLGLVNNANVNMDASVFQGLNLLGSCSAPYLILELVDTIALKQPNLS